MSRHSSAVAVGIGAGAASSRRWGFAILMVGVAVYYLFLLSNGSFRIFAPELLDKVFGNMLLHMLHGEFYVDPKVISFEGFAHDGRTYSYFGVFPALLRLLAMPFTDVGQAPLARLSCWVAVVIFVGLQLRMLLIVHDSLPSGRRAPLLLAAMAAATVLSGPQLYILGAAAIYHEPILWAAVIAAAFNLVVVRAAFGGADLGDRDMTALAALAGLALLTRVSIGATLYFGAVLLIGWTVWRRHGPGRFARPSPAGDWRLPAAAAAALRDPGLWLPLVVLGAAAAAVGAINFERWGNPLTFVDFHDYFWFKKHPDFLAVYDNYGEFDLGRVWIGALYYATGIPYVLKSIPPFAGFLLSRVALIEAPPFTPLLTNPLTVVLAGVGLYRLWWKPDLAPGALGAPAPGVDRPRAGGAADFRGDGLRHALPLRSGPVHDIGGVRRLPLGIDRGRRGAGRGAASDPRRRDRIVRPRHPRQPLRAADPQGVEHRRAHAGPPRAAAVRAVRPRRARAVTPAAAGVARTRR